MHPSYKQLFFILISIFTCAACQQQANQQPQQASSAMKTADSTEKILRHVVLFKFKEEAQEEDIQGLNESFQALASSISVVKDFEWGLNDSPEDLHQGFTHCYLLSFASEEDRDSVYAPHPKHQAFVASLQPHLEKVLVVDYWANR